MTANKFATLIHEGRFFLTGSAFSRDLSRARRSALDPALAGLRAYVRLCMPNLVEVRMFLRHVRAIRRPGDASFTYRVRRPSIEPPRRLCKPLLLHRRVERVSQLLRRRGRP